MTTKQCLLGPYGLGKYAIHSQSLDSCPADIRPPDHSATFPLEMLSPNLMARIEE
jgi:hypothetical protein